MGKLQPRTEGIIGTAATAAVCTICNSNLTREHEWPATMAVYHCEGQSTAGRPHHHHHPTWGNCWKCAKPLGCVKCAAHSIEEAFCWRCKCWGTREAFVYQGLLGGQAIEDYPAGWHHAYRERRARV